MIPILYEANETEFKSMGLGVLRDTIKAHAEEERNGQFLLELKYPKSGLHFEKLAEQRIIKADAGLDLKDQLFVIVRITKPKNGIVTIYSMHITQYITKNDSLDFPVNFTGHADSALNAWRKNLLDSPPLTTSSDITHDQTGEWTIDQVENARRALGGVQGSILDLYGGEYMFDNWHISLLKNRGVDEGALISYGKNLTDINQDIEIDSVYTSVQPYATVRSDDPDEEDEIITLDEKYIDSENADKFQYRKIKVVDLTDESIDSESKLRSRAKQYVEDNDVGVPKNNISLKFVDLRRTQEYEQMERLEKIHLCDWVYIDYYEYGIDLVRAKVIRTVWDVLKEEYYELEIGNARASFTSTVDNAIDEKVDKVEKDILTVQIQANGKNRIFRGSQEPKGYLLEGDLWYKPVRNGEVEVYQWNGSKWEEIISNAVNEETKERIENVKELTDKVGEKAQGTIDDINKVVTDNGFTTLDDLFASKLATDNFGTMFYQESKAIGLTYEENGETKAIIAIQDGYPYIKGEHVILDGDTIVDGDFTVTDEIFAEEMNISKFTTGTLNAKDVNLVNVNVDSLVGNKSNFVRTAWNAINSSADIDGNRLRFTHDDGTSTEIGKDGLRRKTTHDNREYHYLLQMQTFTYGKSSKTETRWIQLADDFKGKDFKVYLAIADSLNAKNYHYAIQRFVCTIHPRFNIDYKNARVPIIAYKSETKSDGEKPEIREVQGLLLAIY